jgi:hypothetical protein
MCVSVVSQLPSGQLITTDSGHSDQQDAENDLEEEDGLDESALFSSFLSLSLSL